MSDAIDEYAEHKGITRAQAMRSLLARGIASTRRESERETDRKAG